MRCFSIVKWNIRREFKRLSNKRLLCLFIRSSPLFPLRKNYFPIWSVFAFRKTNFQLDNGTELDCFAILRSRNWIVSLAYSRKSALFLVCAFFVCRFLWIFVNRIHVDLCESFGHCEILTRKSELTSAVENVQAVQSHFETFQWRRMAFYFRIFLW